MIFRRKRSQHVQARLRELTNKKVYKNILWGQDIELTGCSICCSLFLDAFENKQSEKRIALIQVIEA